VSKEVLDGLIDDHRNKRHFSVVNLEVNTSSSDIWVKIRFDPEAFTKAMFDGNWADPNKHPEIGSIKVLRVMTGHDGISRVIARQGDSLFAYPWTPYS
jgi:hypothetical protein